MQLYIKTSDARALLRAIYGCINAGTVRTWRYNRRGWFTHMPSQWKQCAWLIPVVSTDNTIIRFSIIIATRNQPDIPELTGTYFGRFTEMLLTHFSLQITRLYIK